MSYGVTPAQWTLLKARVIADGGSGSRAEIQALITRVLNLYLRIGWQPLAALEAADAAANGQDGPDSQARYLGKRGASNG